MDKKGRMLTAGGIFFLANALLAGCDSSTDGQPTASGRQGDWGSDNAVADRAAGVMTEVREVAPGQYRIMKEYPSTVTGVVAQKMDGSLEIIPAEKVQTLMQGASGGDGFALGAVLAGGLAGYMVGKNTAPSPTVYADQDLYRQSLANRELIDKRRQEREQYTGGSGYRSGGRVYSGSARPGAPHEAGTVRKTGFFSRFASVFHGGS